MQSQFLEFLKKRKIWQKNGFKKKDHSSREEGRHLGAETESKEESRPAIKSEEKMTLQAEIAAAEAESGCETLQTEGRAETHPEELSGSTHPEEITKVHPGETPETEHMKGIAQAHSEESAEAAHPEKPSEPHAEEPSETEHPKESTENCSKKTEAIETEAKAEPEKSAQAPEGVYKHPEKHPGGWHEGRTETRTEKESNTEEVYESINRKGDFRMCRDALFCDGTSSYVIPPEPVEGQMIRLRFRTARNNVSTVLLVADSGIYQMERVLTRGVFDYYEIHWKLGTEAFSYYFEIHCDDEVCYYNRTGVSDDIKPHYSFRIVPGFSTPNWAKGAVMYQIFVDRFYNGNSENDVKDREYIYIGEPVRKVEDWNEMPHAMDVRRFYGGDLQGVMEKLDYLQDLGVEVIYFNPLFVSPSNHKYDIQDYDYIDPHFGIFIQDGEQALPEGAEDNTQAELYKKRVGDLENLEASNELFIRLVEEIHRRGMRVILDGVFNHCGSFNKWMDRERIYESRDGYEKGAFISKDSPYRSFFYFHNNEDSAWPYNTSYDGWWGNDTLPKLNYEDSRKLEDYIMEIGRKWVSPPYNVDGWRLDVAADLGHTNEYNHAFWKRFRKEIKSARPDALILAEHYGDPADWLQGDEWDSIMNYDAFMEPLTWFLTGMEKHSDEFRPDLLGNADYFVNTMNHFMSCMQTSSLQTAMNELSNHDHSRFLTRTNQVVGRLGGMDHRAAEEGVIPAVMAEAVAVQMTWVGAPTVYYGDEAGVCGFTDPDSRRPYPWGKEKKRMIDFHREMIRIHKTERPLRTGSLRMLYWEKDVLAYGRFVGDEQVVVILNNSESLREVTVPVWMAEVPVTGRMKRLIYSYEDDFTTKKDEYIIHNGEIVVNMGRHSVLVAKTKRTEG
jgi:alpha-glucosidase